MPLPTMCGTVVKSQSVSVPARLELLPVTVAKWLERQTLVNIVWGSNRPGGDISQHDGNLL